MNIEWDELECEVSGHAERIEVCSRCGRSFGTIPEPAEPPEQYWEDVELELEGF